MAAEDQPARARLHVTADLRAGAVVAPGGDQARYLGTVLRLEPGAALSLFNGRDGEWSAVVRTLRKDRAELEVRAPRRPQAVEDGPWLAFAPIKKDRLDFLVEKAVELGAGRLLPVITERTIVTRVNRDRLAAQAIEAAEQCERLSVPEVAEPVPLAGLLAGWPADRPLLTLDETGGGVPLAEAAARLGPGRPVGFLCGPEGGFSRRELDAAAGRAFVLGVGLGPRILRAETAAAAALAGWQLLAGDGRRSPRAAADTPPAPPRDPSRQP